VLAEQIRKEIFDGSGTVFEVSAPVTANRDGAS
jgi:hypothetical protein